MSEYDSNFIYDITYSLSTTMWKLGIFGDDEWSDFDPCDDISFKLYEVIWSLENE
jgi:uncharacterized protein YkuJ